MRLIAPLFLAALCVTPAAAKQAAPVAASANCEGCARSLAEALAHPRRDADRARDAFRNPSETLEFFQVKPDMTVVEYMPGSGWYTRILVPYLGGKGRYIGLNPDVSDRPDGMKAYFGGLAQSLPAKAAGWTGVPAERIAAYNADAIPDGLKGSVDRVLMIRSLHNLWRNGLLYRELMTVRDLLKEDGFLGIVQHRAKGDAPAAFTNGQMGYMREDDVIAMVEAHGFRYSGMTDVNANPKDTADHPQGVWELPPSLRTKREDLKAVGESDRMTLLFRKRP